MDQAALLELIRDNRLILYKISASYCRNASDREDLVQEMIYQIWRSGHRFDDNQKFTTWMYRIALNVAISYYRKASRSGIKVEMGADFQELEDRGDGGEPLAERVALLQRFISELGELDKARLKQQFLTQNKIV